MMGLAICTGAARAEIVYDFSVNAGVDRFGYKNAISNNPIPPAVSTVPATPFTATEYSAAATSDNTRQVSSPPKPSARAATRFLFTINESSTSFAAVTVSWEGFTQSGGTAQVYIWNAFTSSYTLVGSTTATTDTTVTATFTANPGHYLNSSNQLIVLALNTTPNKSLSTDFIRVSLRQCESDTECNDGNECTTDSCNAGGCVHSNNTNACTDDGNACTDDVCSAGACTHADTADGTACNDGDACTQIDTCQSGNCTGSDSVACSASDQCHDAGVCNPATGLCSNPAKQDGSGCSDSNACTQTDTCQGGTCTGSNPVICTASDQCHEAGVCNSETGQCSNPAKPDGSACSDANACTQTDVCQDGSCTGSNPVICTASDQCHDAGACNPATGECSNPSKEDGAACDDGRFCTVNDACASGSCEGAPRDCSVSSDQCNTGVCNEKLDQCIAQPVADGTDCDDANACHTSESCQGGGCTGGHDTDCSALNGPCAVASCDPVGPEGNCDTVTPVADDSPCDDGLFCTDADRCVAGLCVGGGTPCELGAVCDEGGDACVECLVGSQCDDGVGCTDDTCDANVCVHTVNNENCPSDGLYCNGSEYCDAELGCQSRGTPCPPEELCNETTDSCGECVVDSDCDDDVDCTDDLCVDGGCRYNANDDNCTDDDLFCNGIELCDNVQGCISSGDPCAVYEFCNEATDTCDQCVTDAHCDDGNPCTVGHACVEGTCQAAQAVDCSGQGDQCNRASCDPLGETGNCSVLTPFEDGTSCDDGFFCTVDDACQAGLCTGGTARDCSNESNPCNVGACDKEADACIPRPVEDGNACDDGLFCTIGDQCTAGTCGGAPRDCAAAGNQCNEGICNEETNSCEAQPVEDDTACDDENACTRNDACNAGVCASSITYALIDWNALAACLAGPDDGLGEECGCYDYNDDGHLDMLDVDVFMRSFDGQ